MNESVQQVYEQAWQEYLQTGRTYSYYASTMAVWDAAIYDSRTYAGYSVRFAEPIDLTRLATAVQTVAKLYPYVAFDIDRSGSKICFTRRDDYTLKISNDRPEGQYIVIGCEDNQLSVTISHVITDGAGLHPFIGALLDAYVGNKPSAWQGLTQPDSVADLMACDLPLPEGYEMHDFAAHDPFVAPESEVDEPRIVTYRMKAKALAEYCKLHGISRQVAVSYAMARAINLVHPEDARTICVRGPISTNRRLGVPNTFQNSSLPNVFLNMNPSELSDNPSPAIARRLQEELAAQTTYEHLAAVTNRFGRLVRKADEDRDAFLAAFMDYMSKSDVLVSNLGNLVSDEVAPHIKDMDIVAAPAYPLTLYFMGIGDAVKLRLASSVNTDAYAEALDQVLGKLGAQREG